MLGDVARQARDLVAELGERTPAGREELAIGVRKELQLFRDALGVPAFGDARDPLELGIREAERLADVADGAAASIGGERGHESGMLAPVALRDRDDQLLADVARKVEIDVGDGVELAVEEAAERELRADRVHVREACQVADQRADRGAAAAAGWQRVPRRVSSAHLERAFARELEHVPVQEEEAREAELVDELELLVEPR